MEPSACTVTTNLRKKITTTALLHSINSIPFGYIIQLSFMLHRKQNLNSTMLIAEAANDLLLLKRTRLAIKIQFRKVCFLLVVAYGEKTASSILTNTLI